MPKVIGLCCALVALASAVIGQVGTPAALTRAAGAFFIGLFLTQAWYAFLAPRLIEKPDSGNNPKEEAA